jgi:hypothetical protein
MAFVVALAEESRRAKMMQGLMRQPSCPIDQSMKKMRLRVNRDGAVRSIDATHREAGRGELAAGASMY